MFIVDEAGQGAAEYILLFGGVIVVAIAALVLYQTYIRGASELNGSEDIEKVRSSANK
ncbi:hypothetical protein DSECCO2_432370 [anaerobic digester metagenome]|jgi:Flp pilus assembly pilin Flp|nr:MAG: class III signal peptide-containing protein [Methanobacteriales archaeon HGW-Methanobacteriales-2]